MRNKAENYIKLCFSMAEIGGQAQCQNNILKFYYQYP